VSHRQKRQFLRARVGHVNRYREELLKKEKDAESHALHLPVQEEVGSQHERNAQLEECASRYGEELAEKTEQQVSPFVNGNKDEVHPLGKARSTGRLKQENCIESDGNAKDGSRDRLPVLLKRRKKGQAFGPGVGQVHRAHSSFAAKL